MHLTRPRLHPLVIDRTQLPEVERLRAALPPRPSPRAVTGSDDVTIPLTTISAAGNFDAYIDIAFSGQAASTPTTSLAFDSGNSMLVVPSFAAITDIPDWQSTYKVLATGVKEPWGCTANIVQGPIVLAGGTYTLEGVIFYAVTDDSDNPTANFGAGVPTPWSANGWNVHDNITMQAPLSYDTSRPFAVLIYGAADSVLAADGSLKVDDSSSLVMRASQPSDFAFFDVIPKLEWTAITPQALSIAGTTTGWPGDVSSPIAMIDSGGGPVFLSDPNKVVVNGSWPDAVSCPGWTSNSKDCQCVAAKLGITLTDGNNTFSYTIDPAKLPASVQGLSLVMCEVNQFMEGENGMNIGGLSILITQLTIDYGGARVGFKNS